MKKRSGFIGLRQLVVLAAGIVCLSACDNGNGGDPSSESTPTPTPSVTTYGWSFSDLDLSAATFVAAAETGSDTDGSDGSVAKVTVGGIDSVMNYGSTPDGIQLVLSNGASDGSFNKINTVQSAKGEGSAGAVEPSKADMVYAELAGPFTAKMFYAANSSSDKSDRTAQITVNGTATFGPENSVPAAGTWLEASYTGTDTVRVCFGGTNVVRIHDIYITK